jgi:hypothetical protein
MKAQAEGRGIVYSFFNLGFKRSVVKVMTLLLCLREGDSVQRRLGGARGARIFLFFNLIIIIIIYLTASGLSSGGSGYYAYT